MRAASGNTIGVRWRPAAGVVCLVLAAGLAVGGCGSSGSTTAALVCPSITPAAGTSGAATGPAPPAAGPAKVALAAGDLYALNAATGAILLKTALSAGSNAPVTVDGDYVIAGAGVALSNAQQSHIIAYKLGATGKLSDTVGS